MVTGLTLVMADIRLYDICSTGGYWLLVLLVRCTCRSEGQCEIYAENVERKGQETFWRSQPNRGVDKKIAMDSAAAE